MPRKKGAKSKLGIPIKNLREAIELTKMVYDSAGDKSMSFQELAEFMKLPKGISTPVVGAIKDYQLIEKSDLGWRVSQLGKNAIFGDIEAVKQIFTKNPILADLYNKFGDQDVTPGIIESHLRSKYKKGKNVVLIIKRFLDGLDYIKSLESGKVYKPVEEIEPRDTAKWFKVIQLKYALNPSPKEEISKLADMVAKEFENVDDVALNTLSNSIKENKNNKEVLTILVDNLIKIAREEYPIEIFELDAKTKTKEEKQKTSKTEESKEKQ
jgi:hypothetical protein